MTAPPAPAPRPVTLVEARRRRPAVGGGVPSPCVGVCRIDPATGWCAGCWRTLDEIAAWGGSDDATRLRIWAAVEARQTRQRGHSNS
ncbi:DUF1289 domain-containing protein [Tepidimonas charontis]|uniref:Fe-S protein n=1 Tax=Tepidimonas charontis TaxID=2267262 RepID=A0A554X1S1_9BURK|nr:DUF1289 domain-containing protein [Tepidimonas charontis]TSE29802.1 hypothetical protein Tchar_02535 [Tepidimonas charontis]